MSNSKLFKLFYNKIKLNVKVFRYSYHLDDKFSRLNKDCNEKSYLKFKISICGLLFGGFLYIKLKEYSKKYLKHDAFCSVKEYTKEEVKKHKTKETGIWVTYNNVVYDITEFVDKHPGGDKIYLAAGGPVEPFWSLYAIHKSNEVLEILKEYEIGKLTSDPNDIKEDSGDDPFKSDPERHPALQVISNKPFNAEIPSEIITDNFLTPNPLFFVRNHLPVPVVDIENFRLILEGIGINTDIKLNINEIKSLKPISTVESTIMCSGNRRKDMFKFKAVRGLSWSEGAISTAKWTGIRLVDMLSIYNIQYELLVKRGAKHIQFEGLDTDPTGARYGASIPIEVALDQNSDILLAWDMNGEELPLDHGYPLRVIIPGIIGARQVKWLTKIVISDKESDSFWQQNDYKTFSPSVNFDSVDYSSMPAIMESNVQSAICVPRDGQAIKNDGVINVKGYAWSGAGRGIIRVEISTDNGETWMPATITQSRETPTSSNITRKQWTWVFWEIDLPVKDDCRELEILCKAVDSSQNTQPDSYKGTWNVRGLLANAWHRIKITLYDD